MKYLKIKNKGLLDIRLVALMGGTTKAGNVHKIGNFGTGLKYSLAYMFRNKIDFKIYIGASKVEITLDKEQIGEELFEIICINGHRTSITTKMGLEWKPWMIVRELYSNALDEGEATYSVVDSFEGNENETCFYIELTPEFLEVYNDWNKYFIVNHVPFYEHDNFSIHPTSGNLKIYKQGILIHESTEKALFNYDLKFAQINEMREYRGHLISDLVNLFFEIDDSKVITYILEHLTSDKYYEAEMDLDYWASWGTMNNAWKNSIGDAKIIHPEVVKTIQDKGANIDLSGTIEVPKQWYKVLTKNFEGVGALRTAQKVNEFYEIYDQELEKTLKKSLAILEHADYFIHPELKFIFGEFGAKSKLACVNIDSKEIFISQRMKDKSLFDFCSMLVEENEHFQTGFNDHTREFQQHFIDLYTKSILTKSEVEL